MAIIRCPYCHAIIDEAAKYCNNCGTQLLFPDDETLEEEIPGEKIIDADVEDKDYELDEPKEETEDLDGQAEDEEKGDGEPEQDDIEDTEEEEIKAEDLEEALAEEQEDDREEKPATGELEEDGESGEGEEEEGLELEHDEITADGEEGIETEDFEEVTFVEEGSTAAKTEEKSEDPREENARVGIDAKEGDSAAASADLDTAEVEYIRDSQDTEEPAKTGEPEEREPAEDETATVEIAAKLEDTFDTRELDKLGKTVDLGKERVDRFLEVMAEKEKEAVEEEDARARPRPGEKADTGGTLPPWADVMVGAPSFDAQDNTDVIPPGRREEDTSEEEIPPGTDVDEEPPEEAEETGILPRRRTSDSGIGYPERLTQPVLPFSRETAAEEAEAGDREEEGERVLPRKRCRDREEFLHPAEEEQEEARARSPFNLTDFAKAKAFDCLFLAVLWLVTSWFAARALDTTLFRLFATAGGLLLALYFTFILMYFFLFQFFLGETLGDRIFRKKG